MAIENEVKIQIDDVDAFRDRLHLLNARMVSARHFEDNYILDFYDGQIRARGCLLRVRIVPEGALLTFKEAARPGVPFKTREELESPVSDGGAVLEIFQRIGLRVSFRYQKYREEFRAQSGEKSGSEVHVAVDETPIGNYAEFEGAEDCIREVAKKMAISEARFLRDSYYALYVRFCQERGQDPGHMLFAR